MIIEVVDRAGELSNQEGGVAPDQLFWMVEENNQDIIPAWRIDDASVTKGLHDPVVAWYAAIAGTLDEAIFALLKKKAATVESAVGSIEDELVLMIERGEV